VRNYVPITSHLTTIIFFDEVQPSPSILTPVRWHSVIRESQRKDVNTE
jgi:hypothetical protein